MQGILFSLPELWSLELCSAWNLHGYTQQPWEWLIQEKKKKKSLLSTEPKWRSELWNYKDKVELLTACDVVQGQPTWQMLWHSYCSESGEEATSSVSCTWARVWRLIYHYACRKGKWAILSRRNREVNSMTHWGNYHRYIWQWFR